MADYNVGTPKIVGSGSSYTFPHAPDLKVTMISEMDGVDRVRTKGGNDLVNHKYHKARAGRRSWLISYSYFGESDDLYSVIKNQKGGKKSFTFMPDSSHTSYSATCKFDMKLFQFKQFANGLFSVKLKIRVV